MEKVLEKKVQHLEKELKEVKDYTLRDIIVCEDHIRSWRNRYLRLKEYCQDHIPNFSSIVDEFDE